jgi:membrane-bound metal-dependent hydrolase YbcI (DUF457 family)
MNAGPHLAIGAACGLALTGGWSAEHAPAIGFCAAAALLPDLDHHGSVASSWLGSGLSLVALAAGVLAATHTEWIAQQPVGANVMALLASLLPRVSRPLQLLLLGVATGVLTFVVASVVVERLEPWRWVEHRGPLHAPIVLPLVGCVAWLLLGSVQLGLVVMAGWASHLIADAPTYRGLPLLWPYSKRMMHLTPAMLRWHSGTAWIEWPLALASLALSTRLTRL